MSVRVKICGITSVADALACVDAGADAVGLNLVPASRRCVTEEEAIVITRAVGARSLVVLVVADLRPAAMAELLKRVGAGCLQLHGDEAPRALLPLLPHAYKAVRIASAQDVARARAYPGEYLLVDAKVRGELGGTGASFDWGLVAALAQERKLVLAGGLTPENVAAAIRIVHPDCVDVASGVEAPGDPRTKDLARVRAFLTAAREA
jgi:phosphoribosylanthranilate isomerase